MLRRLHDADVSSRKSVNARVRNCGVGTKSASRIEMKSGGSAAPTTAQRVVDVAGLGVGVVGAGE